MGRLWLASGGGSLDSTGHLTSLFTTFTTPWFTMSPCDLSPIGLCRAQV